MPYIEPSERKPMKKPIGDLMAFIETPGQLTYAIYKMCKVFATKASKLRFVRICLVIGVLICTALEFYRRVAAPYEDVKIQENGDV
ncbi:MAG: DUF6899 family protein [Candidatus Thorarchaeota archaeon]|jgi:hypothetical protein